MTRRGTPTPGPCDWIPTPDDLDHAPELAILAALDHTLELAASALACAHPELLDPERPSCLGSPTRAAILAKTLVRRTSGLQRALRTYRKAVDELRQRHGASRNRDDVSF